MKNLKRALVAAVKGLKADVAKLAKVGNDVTALALIGDALVVALSPVLFPVAVVAEMVKGESEYERMCRAYSK